MGRETNANQCKGEKGGWVTSLSLLLSTSLGSSGHHVEGFFFEKKGKKKTHLSVFNQANGQQDL